MSKLKIVRVEWVDAFSVDEWAEIKEVAGNDEIEMVTVGILLVSKKEHVIVANTHDAVNEKCAGSITIPRGCIKNYRVIGTESAQHTPKVKKEKREKKVNVVKQSDSIGQGKEEAAEGRESS
jgi:hypothetical protein